MSTDLETQVVQLQGCPQGPESDAFGAIVRMYGGMVYGTGLRITGDAHHAADITQETFFHLLQSAGGITGSLGGWLHRVATRRAIDVVRRDRSRRRREQLYAEQRAIETDTWGDISPLVDEALNEMDEGSRNLIIRHFLQGEKMVEIAAADGVSQPTVSRRVEQALRSLRERLRLKGVGVAIGVLGGLMANSTASAVPIPVLVELGKMSALSAGAAGAAGKTALGLLKLKLTAVVLLAVAGTGGYIAYQFMKDTPPPPPAAAVPARAAPLPTAAAVPMGQALQVPVAQTKGKALAAGVATNRTPALAAQPGTKRQGPATP